MVIIAEWSFIRHGKPRTLRGKIVGRDGKYAIFEDNKEGKRHKVLYSDLKIKKSVIRMSGQNYCEDCGGIKKLAPSDVVLVQKEIVDIISQTKGLKNKGGMQSPAITKEIGNAVKSLQNASSSLKKVQGLLK